MKAYKLFEIPVYNYSKEKHLEMWSKAKKKFFDKLTNKNATQSEKNDSFLKCYKYQYLWDYNKLVGIIQIKYKNGDLIFELYKHVGKVFYNKINKMRFEKNGGTNLRITIKNKSKDEIIKLIQDKFKYIQDNFFKKYNYLDLEAFNNIVANLNFEAFLYKITKK